MDRRPSPLLAQLLAATAALAGPAHAQSDPAAGASMSFRHGDYDEDVADALGFLSRVRVDFPVVHDDGRLASAWAPPAMPSAYLIDRDGRIHSRHLGFRPGDIDGLRNEVRNLIEARDAP